MGKGKNGIPDRWLKYQAMGQCIPGTKIVAFKVPLKLNICQKNIPEEKWFTPEILLEQLPELKTIIDLTNTNRYYNGEMEFGTKGVDHVKIMVEGRGTLPTQSQLQKFFDAVDNHMKKYSDASEAVIGVHCTHGLNRTGYFVCRWMVDRLNMNPDEAIARFNTARGHVIERKHLLDDLRKKNVTMPYCPKKIHHHYSSPLDDSSYDEPSTNSRYARQRQPIARNDNYGRNKSDWDNRDKHGAKKARLKNPGRADLDTNWRRRD